MILKLREEFGTIVVAFIEGPTEGEFRETISGSDMLQYLNLSSAPEPYRSKNRYSPRLC